MNFLFVGVIILFAWGALMSVDPPKTPYDKVFALIVWLLGCGCVLLEFIFK